jgi:hypothetical protein
MSLRDYFAAAALTGMFADGTMSSAEARMEVANERDLSYAELMSEMAYRTADAMLAQREKAP